MVGGRADDILRLEYGRPWRDKDVVDALVGRITGDVLSARPLEQPGIIQGPGHEGVLVRGGPEVEIAHDDDVVKPLHARQDVLQLDYRTAVAKMGDKDVVGSVPNCDLRMDR